MMAKVAEVTEMSSPVSWLETEFDREIERLREERALHALYLSTRKARVMEIRCAAIGCATSTPGHRYGKIRAAEAGWFFQRSGVGWCSAHVPTWATDGLDGD